MNPNRTPHLLPFNLNDPTAVTLKQKGILTGLIYSYTLGCLPGMTIAALTACVQKARQQQLTQHDYL